MSNRIKKSIAALAWATTFAAALALAPRPAMADMFDHVITGPGSSVTSSGGTWTVVTSYSTPDWSGWGLPMSAHVRVTGRWVVNVRGDYNQSTTTVCAAGLFVDGNLVGTTKSISLAPVTGVAGYSYGLIAGELDPNYGVLLGPGSHYVALQIYSPTTCSADANTAQLILRAWPTAG